MPLAQTPFYALIFSMLCIIPHHINAMENFEKSIQENLTVLDQQILKTAMLIKKQENTIRCTQPKNTEYLKKQKTNASWLSSCDATDDVIPDAEMKLKQALKTYETLRHKKERLEKASALFQSNFERGKRFLEPSEHDDLEYIEGVHKQTIAHEYLETVAKDLARYTKEES